MARPRDTPADGGAFTVIAPLARGMEVLRAFQAGDPPLRNQDLSRRTGIPASSVSRLTASLVAQGYLSYDANGGSYTLTPAVLAFAYAFVAGDTVRSRLQPGMQDLANTFGAMVGLGMQDKLNMAYVACCKGQSLVPFRSEIGSRYPLARSAMGWAYLAGLDEAAFAVAMDEIKASDAGAWPQAQKKIETAKKQVHAQGFCVSIGEWEPGVHTVATPVRTRTNETRYAISCGAPAYQLKEDQLMVEIGPRLAWLARSVQQDPAPAV
ncbi:helix-turn-helix domain-containing protein [Bordetella petrii]|nr:helix-turn-helix domain-containing protein [Bordetella petrii]